MGHRLQTPEGKRLYALRKQTPEPVFGIIKSVLGFRQFLLRGLDRVRGEWNLVTMAWNMKRMFVLASAICARLAVRASIVGPRRTSWPCSRRTRSLLHRSHRSTLCQRLPNQLNNDFSRPNNRALIPTGG